MYAYIIYVHVAILFVITSNAVSKSLPNNKDIEEVFLMFFFNCYLF